MGFVHAPHQPIAMANAHPIVIFTIQHQTMSNKKVLLTLGGKGGTGKTLFCRTLFHFLHSEGVQVTGLDADRENPEFWDYNKEDITPVHKLNFLTIDGARKFINRLDKYQPDVVLLDMPGASGAATRDQFRRLDIFNTLQNELNGYEIIVTTVLNESYNTISSLGVMMESFGDQASYVAVLSRFWEKETAPFKRWRESNRYELFTQLKGKEVVLPVLEKEVFDVLHEKAWPFSKLNQLELGDRILLRSYLTRSRASFDAASDYLGLPALEGRDANELVLQGVAARSAKKAKKSTQKTETQNKAAA